MSFLRKAILFSLLLAVVSVPTVAQEYRGNLYLTITTEDGTPVSGASVMVTGAAQSRTAETNEQGQVRFIKLEPGFYTAEVSKDGFNIAVYTDIELNTGANTNMDIAMQRSEIVERVVVTSRTPVLDRRNDGTGTVLSTREITQLPQARDPWATLSTIPGIQQDRINVGGNQSGQQSGFAGKGSDGTNATWVMDGVEFTDLAADGSSSTYFDFNSFQEIGFATGGGALEQSTPGQQLSFVTKQGANRHTGSIGLILADAKFQDDPADYQNPDGTAFIGNSINEVFEKNFEIGGPIVKDMAWYWFGFNQNDVDLRVPGASPDLPLTDNSVLRNVTAKINGTAGNLNYKVFYTRGDKAKFGRNAGPDRPQPTTWNQSGPTPIYTADISYFVTPNVELSFQGSHVGGGFQLVPQASAGQVRYDENFVFQDTYVTYITDRPINQFVARGNWFLDSGKTSNEFKFGFKYKEGSVQSLTQYGTQNALAFDYYYGSGQAYNSYAYLYREGSAKGTMEYLSAWFGDTILVGNWTFNIGAQYQTQSGVQDASYSPANPLAPTVLPELNFVGYDPNYDWANFLPRVGFTYTLDAGVRHLFKASYGRYVDQLGIQDITFSSPANVASATYVWDDVGGNNDKLIDPGEINTAAPAVGYNNFLPTNAVAPVNYIDTDLEAPIVDEAIIGYEVEVMKDFSIGINGTYRTRDKTTWTPWVDMTGQTVGGASVSAFNLLTLPDFDNTVTNDSVACFDTVGPCYIPTNGDSYDINTYTLNAAGVNKSNIARPGVLTNRDGYTEDFIGAELTLTKRLSNNWMLRGYVAWQDWTRNIDCTATDPVTGACIQGPGVANPNNDQGDVLVDGSIVAPGGLTNSGSFNDVFFGTSTWSYNINGLYQLPLNFTISANLNGREGYVAPLWRRSRIAAPDGIVTNENLQVLGVDSARYDDMHVLDLKLAYLLVLAGDTTVDLSFEVFNTLGDDTLLQVESRQNVSSAGRIDEALSPRIFRLGARVTF